MFECFTIISIFDEKLEKNKNYRLKWVMSVQFFQTWNQDLVLWFLFQTFDQAVGNLRPSPTDTCPLWLRNAIIAALPLKSSRHNTPSRAHSLSKLVKSCLTDQEEYVVVIIQLTFSMTKNMLKIVTMNKLKILPWESR